MQLPSRYKRYKAGTEKVIDFLKTSTANASWKQKAKSKAIAGSSVQELEDMTATIVNATNPEIDIPLEIVVVLEDVIKGRTESAKMYSLLHVGQHKADSMHRHFIEALKRIRNALHTALIVRRARANTNIEELESRKHAILANIFEYLTVEESSEEIQLAEEPQERSDRLSPKKTMDSSSPALTDGKSEAMFALWCFFMDAMDIRNYLYDVWTDYYVGNLSLTIAAETTNIAFTLILKTELRLKELFPKVFNTYSDILKFIGLKIEHGRLSTGVTIDDAEGTESGAEDIEIGFQIQALFCMHAYRICHDFLVLSPRGKGATHEHRDFILNNADSWHPFAGLLYGLLPDIKILAVRDPGLKMDVVTDWLIKMHQSGHIIPSLVVAVQIYMMIYDVLGNKNYEFCFQHLRLRSEEAKKTLDDRLALAEQLWVKADRARPHLIREREHIQNFISEDWLSKQRKKQRLNAADDSQERHRLFRSLPVLCGHLIFETQIFLHINGIQNSITNFSVLGAAYIYKAARVAGMKTEWTDMEFVIAEHSRPGAFIFDEGDSSAPLASMARHYCRALGVPLNMLKQSGALDATAELVLPVIPHDPKLLQKTRQLEVELPFLAEMMRENERGGQNGWMEMTEAALTRIALRFEGSKVAKSSVQQSKAANCVPKSILELMHALRLSLATSEADMNFRYLEFWNICANVLEQVGQNIRPEILRSQSGVIPVTMDYQVVTAILWQAAHAEKATSTLQLGDTWLAQAAKLLEAELSKHGPDKLVTATFKTCGGHMAEAWKPINRDPRKPNALYGDTLSVPPGLVVLASPEYEAAGALTRFDARTNIFFTRYVDEATGKLKAFTHRYIAPGTKSE